ncbi:MAG TPA: hypothetical protein VKN36_04390 [Eudoraea sp.]|nr:hypothetical protein [Eudoraea sp.]
MIADQYASGHLDRKDFDQEQLNVLPTDHLSTQEEEKEQPS